MKYFKPVVCCAALAIVANPVAAQETDQQQQVLEIINLGGKVGVYSRTGTTSWVGRDDVGAIGGATVARVLFKDRRTTDAALDQLKGFSHLVLLDLASTRITDEGLAKLEDLKDLASLDLENTQITDAGLKRLSKLSKMQSLNLTQTKVTDAGVAHLNGMAILHSLKLTGTAFGDAGIANLRTLKTLESLGVGGTQLTDAGLAALGQIAASRWVPLTDLDIGSTRVTDAGLANLAGLKKLKRVRVDHTAVTDEGVLKLRRALPGVQILR